MKAILNTPLYTIRGTLQKGQIIEGEDAVRCLARGLADPVVETETADAPKAKREKAVATRKAVKPSPEA